MSDLASLLAENRAELLGFVAALVDTLKPEYAEAISRVELDEVPVKDYASASRVTAKAAAMRVHRARAALRKQVVQTCGACAEHGCYDCSCAHG